MEIINEAKDKFKDLQDVICKPLFELLRQINAAEEWAYERSEELEKKKRELGLPESQEAPGMDELWEEYGKRLSEITKPYCTEKLSANGGSFGSPTKYAYIDEECKVVFIMKSAKKAVVETHFNAGVDEKNKFVFKDVDGKWLLDEVYYGFEDETAWYSDGIR